MQNKAKSEKNAAILDHFQTKFFNSETTSFQHFSPRIRNLYKLWTSDFGKWGQNRPQNIPHEKGQADRQTDRHRDSMKESAKGRFFENYGAMILTPKLVKASYWMGSKQRGNVPFLLLLLSPWQHVARIFWRSKNYYVTACFDSRKGLLSTFMFYRPGVAGAVLQTASSFISWLTHWWSSKKYFNVATPRRWKQGSWK